MQTKATRCLHWNVSSHCFYLDFVHIVDSLIELHRLLWLQQTEVSVPGVESVDETVQGPLLVRPCSAQLASFGRNCATTHLLLLGYQVLHGNLVALHDE